MRLAQTERRLPANLQALEDEGEAEDGAGGGGWYEGGEGDEVTVHSFVLETVIGTGGFGKVWKARKRSTGESFAVKIQHRPDPVREKSRAEQIERERSILEVIIWIGSSSPTLL